MPTSTELVIAPCIDNPDVWYWEVRVPNGIYASGEADDREQAARRAEAAYEEWRAKQ